MRCALDFSRLLLLEIVALVNLNFENKGVSSGYLAQGTGKFEVFECILGSDGVDLENLENPQLLAKINEELIDVDKKLKMIENYESVRDERESEESKSHPEPKEELEELNAQINNLKSSIMSLPSYKHLSQPHLRDILRSYIFKVGEPTITPNDPFKTQNSNETEDFSAPKIVEGSQPNESDVDEATWKERYKQLEARFRQLEAENKVLRLENNSLQAANSFVKEEQPPFFSP